MLVFIFAAVLMSSASEATATGGGSEWTITAHPKDRLIRAGQDTLYVVSFHNKSHTERIIDVTSVTRVAMSFVGEQSAVLPEEVQTDMVYATRKCREAKGWVVIKPGAETTVLVKISTPQHLAGTVQITLILGFWVVTDPSRCQSERVDVEVEQMQEVEVNR